MCILWLIIHGDYHDSCLFNPLFLIGELQFPSAHEAFEQSHESLIGRLFGKDLVVQSQRILASINVDADEWEFIVFRLLETDR